MASAKTMGFKELALAATSAATVALGGHLLYVSGAGKVTGNFTVGGQIVQSGGYVPLRATFANSGQLAIQNPTAYKLKCEAPTVYVTTAASPTTVVDVDFAVTPGVAQNSTGSLFDNLVLSTASVLRTSTGTAVSTADGRKYFLLDEAGGVYDYVYARGVTGTGQGLVGYFHADCYRLIR